MNLMVFNKLLRSPWQQAAIHIVLWFVLVMIVGGIKSHAPDFGEDGATPIETDTPRAVARLEHLFPAGGAAQAAIQSPGLTLFATTHFMSPKKAPPVPATKRRVDLTYRGYYQLGDGPFRVLLKVGDSLVDVPLGGSVLSNYYAASATMTTLTLTNLQAESNQFTLNKATSLEVPL